MNVLRCPRPPVVALALVFALRPVGADPTDGAAPQRSHTEKTVALTGPTSVTLGMPLVGEGVTVLAKAGKAGSNRLTLRLGGGNQAHAAVMVGCVGMGELNHHWGTTKTDKDLPDAALEVTVCEVPAWGNQRYTKQYYIRPDVHFYHGADHEQAVEKWSMYPPASQHVFELQIVRTPEHAEIWIDGRFLTRVAVPLPGVPFGVRLDSPPQGAASTEPVGEPLSIRVAEGAEITAVRRGPTIETDRYLPVDISKQSGTRAGPVADMSIAPGLATVNGIPVLVTDSVSHVDVGKARWLRQEEDGMSFYSPYYKRSTWDGIPETLMWSVPKRHFDYVHLLCAIDPDTDRSPALSVLIARYRQSWDGTGTTQAETAVRIDPGNPEGCESVIPVGTVRMSVEGNTVDRPLYLVSIPLKTGELADFFGKDDWDSRYERTDYFYVELTRQLRTRVSRNYGVFERLPLGPRSGVHVFGMTLEKAPVDIAIASNEVGHVFYVDRDPALSIDVTSRSPRTPHLTMSAVVTDFFGESVRRRERLSLKQGINRTPFPLAKLGPGWYEADFTFADKDGHVVWTQPATFALLPPDTRTAGNESPFGTWWFSGNHYTEPDAERAMPLLQKMGFRHVTPQKHDPATARTADNLARYGVTPSMMPYYRAKRLKRPLSEEVSEFAMQWPGTRHAMIFHETGLPGLGLDLPPELLGQPPTQLEEAHQKQYEKLREEAVTMAAVIRQNAPDMEVVLGNGGTNFNVHWLRTKLPRECWDCIGMEMAVQLFHPESQPTGWNLQSLWIAKRMREIYGYDDLPITSCYEFDYRATAPGALSLKTQANWYTRDVLHCLAYRMPSINVALLDDANSAYYTSRWGSTGVCFRAPGLMPKPGFVALATLTRMLDRAEYTRRLDCGSTGLYCLEFKKETGFVYALWASRGKQEATLEFVGSATGARVVDSMGREKRPPFSIRRHVTVSVDESPRYVLTRAAAGKVSLGTPVHECLGLSGAAIADSLAEAENWRVVSEPDEAFADYCAYKPMVQGNMQLAQAGGRGVRLVLDPQPDVPDIVARYGVLEPVDGPIAVEGRPDIVGVWVNGNSNWGRIIFEITDAKGRRWSSNGWQEAPHSWDMSDWEATTCINFDGWRLVSVPFPARTESGYYAPSFRHWRCHGDNSVGNELAYPIKLSRLYVVMREKLVYLTDMVPAKSMAIELRDLTVGGGG